MTYKISQTSNPIGKGADLNWKDVLLSMRKVMNKEDRKFQMMKITVAMRDSAGKISVESGKITENMATDSESKVSLKNKNNNYTIVKC